MTKLKKLLSSLLLVSLTAGCAGTIGINKPICISRQDVLTEGTKQQILTQDETLGKSCKKEK